MSLEQISPYFTTEVLDEIAVKAGCTRHTSYAFGKGFKKGDSYLGQCFRLKVNGINEETGDSKEIQLVVKSISKNVTRKKLFSFGVYFRHEIEFYTKVIPAFQKFQASKNAKNPFVEYPKCFATYCDGDNDFIALEDLGTDGYMPPSRQEGVDLQQCLSIMRCLGRFHAVSIAIKDQCPEEFERLSKFVEEVYYMESNRAWYAPFLKDAISVACDAVSKEYPGTIYEEKTKKFLDDSLYSKMIYFSTTRSPLTCIGHGDCWTPNFLFKQDNSVKIIDFQIARCSSPAVDITFFLYSCTQHSFREKYYKDILKSYHAAASELLTDLGSNPEKVFSFSALEDELKNFGAFGCGMGLESLPLSMMEDNEILEDIEKEDPILTDVWKVSPLKEKEHRLRIADAFKHAIDNGYIN